MSAAEHLTAAIEAEGEAHRRLLAGDRAGARDPLRQAAASYRASWEAAGPEAYGRLIGLLKASVLAGEGEAAAAYARGQLPAQPGSPTGWYAVALAALAADDDETAARAGAEMAAGGETFARTGDAIVALAEAQPPAYAAALEAIVADFAARPAHLTGVPIADTALVLETLAAPRGLAAGVDSPLLPQ